MSMRVSGKGRLRFRVGLAMLSAALGIPAGLFVSTPVRAAECPWMDAKKTPEQRANELLAVMTVDEKIAMVHQEDPVAVHYGSAGYIPANPDKCIPELALNDGPGGISNIQVGTTAFPAGLARAATWNRSLHRRFGEALGEEAWQKGLNVWLGPGLNIARIPTNGRNFEYSGEDPYFAGEAAADEVAGVQSKHVIATLKHYAANNQETDRSSVSAEVDDRTMHEIYLPAFEAAVKQGGAGSVMCSYNKVNGTYACENPTLLSGYLKNEIGFDGWVMSDWGATHSTTPAANAGLDMDMNIVPSEYYDDALKTAVESGEVPMARFNDMVRRILRTMFRVGVFDYPPASRPAAWGALVSTPEHLALAREISEESTVLLKNEGGILPLDGAGRTIALIGVAAGRGARDVCGGGGSSGVHSCNYAVTPLQGIQQRAAAASDTVVHAEGTVTQDAVAAATAADVAIVFASMISEEGDDAPSLSLDDGSGHCVALFCEKVASNQNALISAVAAANPNTIVVLNTGTPVLMPWLGEVKAVLEAWHPGMEGGNAIAAILFGDANPSGKLPETFPKSEADMPARTPEQYPGVNGRARYSEGLLVGYRHYDAKNITPLFPFGYGLSYTTFRLSGLQIAPAAEGSGAAASVDLTNVGSRAGAEVVQLYVGYPKTKVFEPPKWLRGYDKVTLRPGETRRVSLALDERAFSYWNTKTQRWDVQNGCYQVMVGTSSRDLPLRGVVAQGRASCGSGAVVLGKRVAASAKTRGTALPATGVTEGMSPIGVALLAAGLFLAARVAGANRRRV